MSSTLVAAEAPEIVKRVSLSISDRPRSIPPLSYCGGQEPLFLVALAFCAGILLANDLWRWPGVWLLGFLLPMGGAGYTLQRSPRLAFFLALIAFCPLGAFYLQAHDAAQPTIADDLQFLATGRDKVEITAHVLREGLIRDSPYGGKQESVDIESDELRLDDRVLRESIGIRLTIYSKKIEEERAAAGGNESPLPAYNYGQRLHLAAKLRMPRNYRDPGAMDVAGYFASQGIRLTGSAHALDVEALPGFTGTRIGRWRDAARRSLLARIAQLWPGERGALMQAALIAARASFGRDIKSDFQRTGTYHILVVSGINVGILAFALLWALRRIGLSETWATVLTIVLSWSYAFVADLGSPIVRATIMLNIYLLSRLLFRDRAGLNSLGIAALGILLVNPRSLFEASFQLTFLSVVAVAGIAAPILRRTVYPLQTGLRHLDAPEYDYSHPTLAAEFRIAVRLIHQYLRKVIGRRGADFLIVGVTTLVLAGAQLLFVSLVIQLALALPMAWYFHRAITMSLPANALVLPIAGLLLPGAVLAVGLSYVSPWLAFLPATVAGYALDALTGTVRIVGGFRISDVRVPTPTLYVSLAAASAFCLALLLARRRIAATFGIAALLATAVWIALYPPAPRWRPGIFEITAIDVGQGDSILLVTPEGKTLLMDAGGMPGMMRSDFDVGEEVVSPYLWSRGIQHLDVVAISHAHSDHIGGMRSVIANFHPQELWYGVESPAPGFREVEQTARAFGLRLRQFSSGETLDFGGVHVRVLNPQPGWPARDPAQDDESLVLRLQYGNTSALLVGDAHKRIENFLVHENPQADFLKIGHHGSSTSSSPEFLEAVNPRFAVASVGFYNSFGHPRPEVMQRFAGRHIITYRTDLAGAVSFFLDGKTVTARLVPR